MRCARVRVCFGLVAVALGASLGVARAESPVHLALERSDPNQDQTLSAAPVEVRLWFTQAPQAAATSVRIVAGDESLVESGDPTVDAEDVKVFSVAVGGEMAAGSYTVIWRAMSADGHVVRGEFSFSVSSEVESTP